MTAIPRDLLPTAIQDAPTNYPEDDDGEECWNCDGEGYVYNCINEIGCFDPESGCDLCEQRCPICKWNPRHV